MGDSGVATRLGRPVDWSRPSLSSCRRWSSRFSLVRSVRSGSSVAVSWSAVFSRLALSHVHLVLIGWRIPVGFWNDSPRIICIFRNRESLYM